MRHRHMALEVLLNGFFFLFADWKIPREALGIRLCLSSVSLACLYDSNEINRNIKIAEQ